MIKKQPTQNHIIICAGGTGGHFFPAKAFAERLLEKASSEVQIGMITDGRSASYHRNHHFPEQIQIHSVYNHHFSGTLFSKFCAFFLLILGTLQALFIMIKKRPDSVIGFGGYPSAPGLFAAIILRIPFYIHEQNMVLGRVNRLLAPFAKKIAISFPIAIFNKQNSINRKIKNKLYFTGNPVRREIIELAAVPYPEFNHNAPLELLIFGGSQGAKIFSDIIPEAINKLPEHLKKRINITQQCRKETLPATRNKYKRYSIEARLAPFFEDMPMILKKAHLIICRAGASTLAELAIAKKPAIFIPLPSAIDDHQSHNANYIHEQIKGGWIIPQSSFTPESLAIRLESLLTNPNLIIKTSENIEHFSEKNAADRLIKLFKNKIN